MTAESTSVSREMPHALAEEGRRARVFIASNRSDTLLRLFDFLLQQSIEGRRPNESEIAEQVFPDSWSGAGHQGSRVRVGVYRLRKKLDLFYVGKAGERLIIPSGEYVFLLGAPETPVEQGNAHADRPLSRRQAIWTAASILVLLNALLAWLYLSHPSRSYDSLRDSALWQSFGRAKNAPILVMGDYFTFVQKKTENDPEEVVQDLSINSADAFYEYVTKKPGMRDALSNQDLYAVSADSLGSVSRVSSYFEGAPLQSVTSSELNPDMMKSSDIVYVGALDAISPLLKDPLFLASQFQCGATCYELIDKASGRRFLSDSPYLLGDRVVPRRDYGYIASFPGPSGNRILILSGTGDAAVRQMVSVATDPKVVEQLRRRVGRDLRSFEALYQVRTMFDQTYGSTLLISRPINSDRVWDETTSSN